MTFEDWFNHGCRSGEIEAHCFSNDFPSFVWFAKEAWQASREYGDNWLENMSCKNSKEIQEYYWAFHDNPKDKDGKFTNDYVAFVENWLNEACEELQDLKMKDERGNLGKCVPNTVEVEIEIPDELFMNIALYAHKQDITFNQFVNNALKEMIKNENKV
jgi:predicted HicB family RNase H-like nuclease